VPFAYIAAGSEQEVDQGRRRLCRLTTRRVTINQKSDFCLNFHGRPKLVGVGAYQLAGEVL